MKSIKLIFDENGCIKAQADAVIYEGESFSTQLVLEWPDSMVDWEKGYEILLSNGETASGQLEAVKEQVLELSSSVMVKGTVKIQFKASATKSSGELRIWKSDVFGFDVNEALNVVSNTVVERPDVIQKLTSDLSQEVQSRSTADNSTNEAIQQEVQDRQQADLLILEQTVAKSMIGVQNGVAEFDKAMQFRGILPSKTEGYSITNLLALPDGYYEIGGSSTEFGLPSFPALGILSVKHLSLEGYGYLEYIVLFSTQAKKLTAFVVDCMESIPWYSFASLNESGKLIEMPTATDVGAIATSEKGVANGVATLGTNGRLPSLQAPLYRGAKMLKSGSQSLTGGVEAQVTGWTLTGGWDTNGFKSGETFVIPSGVSKVEVRAQVSCTSGTGNAILLIIYKNTNMEAVSSDYTQSSYIYSDQVSCTLDVVAGDVIKLMVKNSVNQTITENVNGQKTWFSINAIY